MNKEFIKNIFRSEEKKLAARKDYLERLTNFQHSVSDKALDLFAIYLRRVKEGQEIKYKKPCRVFAEFTGQFQEFMEGKVQEIEKLKASYPDSFCKGYLESNWLTLKAMTRTNFNIWFVAATEMESELFEQFLCFSVVEPVIRVSRYSLG